MQKYLAIINLRTGYVFLLSITIAYLCLRYHFGYNLNVTLFSIAVIFPLVFTIRQAFRRRDTILGLLSVFKASANAVYHCFINNNKLSVEKKEFVANKLQAISTQFMEALVNNVYDSSKVRADVNVIYAFLNENSDAISNNAALKITRFIKEMHASIENIFGLKMHGTPVSLRAYCLLFIYIFPVVFIPTLVNDLGEGHPWIIYALSAVHGFILISLYNVQDAMEDPFDQIGLDDVRLDEFRFQRPTF